MGGDEIGRKPLNITKEVDEGKKVIYHSDESDHSINVTA
jgi:hypothetical protein